MTSAPTAAAAAPITPLAIAQRYDGLSERNSVDRETIAGWLARAGLPGSDPRYVPWCGAFAHHVVYLLAPWLGLEPPHLAMRARSWLTVGSPVELEDAKPGYDLVVLARGGGPQPGADVLEAPGHVAWFLSLDPSNVRLYGGNQGDACGATNYRRDRVLGVRRLRP